MAYSDDHIALAAEYALGTLDSEERAQVETLMSEDAEFTELVRSWEYRLGALTQMVGPVEPRPAVWESIKSIIGRAEAQPPSALPSQPPSAPPEPVPPPAVEPPAQPKMSERVTSAIEASTIDTSNVVRLTGQARRWRTIASAVSALAAALVAMLGVQIYAPGRLPEALRPSQPATAAQYVALLQGQGGGPAFILTVDGATRSFMLRRVGASPAAPGTAHELWLISDKISKPRSLGVVGDGDFTAHQVPASYDANVINSATFAITVEQAGGSPDGAPHSAPIYSGKLIETVPADGAAPAVKR